MHCSISSQTMLVLSTLGAGPGVSEMSTVSLEAGGAPLLAQTTGEALTSTSSSA
jgi:hypothetical protein